MDLANFIGHLALDQYGNGKQVAAIGTSLGAAILWYVIFLCLPCKNRKRKSDAVVSSGATPSCSLRKSSLT
jgi:hypothetical protein